MDTITKSEFNMAALNLERLSKLQTDANQCGMNARLSANKEKEGFKKTFEYLQCIKRLTIEVAAIMKREDYQKAKNKINEYTNEAAETRGDELLKVIDKIDDLNAGLLRQMQKQGLMYPTYTTKNIKEKFDAWLGNEKDEDK